MRIKFLGLMAAAIFMLLAIGCSDGNNPVTSDSNPRFLRPNTPAAPAIGGRVWNDVNMDGLQDVMENEPGMAGVSVMLYPCGDTVNNDTVVVASTTTDSLGFYAFDALEPGSYYVQFIRPEGYRFSPADVGEDETIDSDADTLTGMTICIPVDTATNSLYWDAGMYMEEMPTVTIGDRVWHDADMDGIQGDTIDEPGLPGMVVHLMIADTMDYIIDTAITDTMGYYYFEDVPMGEYRLHFMLPEDYMFSPADQGGNDRLDSDADPATGLTGYFTVDTAQRMLYWDAGMYMVEDDGCTYSKGYWKNHAGFGPQDDMVSDLLPIWLGNEGSDTVMSVAVIDAQTAVDILSQHVYGHPSNGITKLYAQLLAAKLNIANGADDSDIADYVLEADNFLTDHGWTDWDDLDRDQRKMILEWKDIFDDYNNGLIGPGHCDGYDDDYDDDWDDEDEDEDEDEEEEDDDDDEYEDDEDEDDK